MNSLEKWWRKKNVQTQRILLNFDFSSFHDSKGDLSSQSALRAHQLKRTFHVFRVDCRLFRLCRHSSEKMVDLANWRLFNWAKWRRECTTWKIVTYLASEIVKMARHRAENRQHNRPNGINWSNYWRLFEVQWRCPLILIYTLTFDEFILVVSYFIATCARADKDEDGKPFGSVWRLGKQCRYWKRVVIKMNRCAPTMYSVRHTKSECMENELWWVMGILAHVSTPKRIRTFDRQTANKWHKSMCIVSAVRWPNPRQFQLNYCCSMHVHTTHCPICSESSAIPCCIERTPVLCAVHCVETTTTAVWMEQFDFLLFVDDAKNESAKYPKQRNEVIKPSIASLSLSFSFADATHRWATNIKINKKSSHVEQHEYRHPFHIRLHN